MSREETALRGQHKAEVKVNPFHDLIAGGVAGSASVIVGHPFDTIKVRLQLSSAASQQTSSTTTSTSSTLAITTPDGSSSKYNYSFTTFRSLFQGMAAPLSSATLVNAIIFASYGAFTRVWENIFENGKHPNDGELFHGTMTSEGAVFIERGEGGIHELIRSSIVDDAAAMDKINNTIVVNNNVDDLSQVLKHNKTYTKFGTDQSMTGDDNISTTNEKNDNNNKPPRVPQDTLKIFACGSAAGALQAFVICPMEHIKCRLQIQSVPPPPTTTTTTTNATTNATTKTTKPIHRPQPAGPIELTKSIIKHHGLFHGLYRGMGVTLWRETPAFGMYFSTYDAIKERVEQVLDDSSASHPIPSHAHAWAASALAGGLSGAWTWVIIYPFDVIKTSIQTSALDRQLQKSMWTVGYELVDKHGWRHMFRGLGVTLIRAFPVNAIIFPTYEFVLLQLGDGR
jgi:hypothetical protein